MHVLLHTLPENHELRNRELATLGAELRLRPNGGWRRITGAWGIRAATYNGLAQFWRDNNDFRVETHK